MQPETLEQAEPIAAEADESDEDILPGVVLEGVPYKLYKKLRDLEENNHTRMTYLDGTLILMSPDYIHEWGIDRVSMIIWEVAEALAISAEAIGATTLRRKGPGPRKGTGKEADNGFYVGPSGDFLQGKLDLDLSTDPPPDLAVEVDNKSDSKLGLSVYARLGVPEVWRIRPRRRTLWIGRLAGRTYETIGRSICLPMLTTELMIEAMAARDGMINTITWKTWLRDWARGLPKPPAP